jgi:hypothetical protein
VFFLQQAQPVTPLIVKIVERPTKEISVADILLGSIGITGLFLVGAAILGLVLGGAFIMVRRWRDARSIDSESEASAFQLTVPRDK